MPRKSFKRQNGRRIELIVKEHGGGLNDAEAAELSSLETWVGDYMAAKHPRDNSLLDEMERRLEAIKRRLEAKKTGDVKDSA